MPNDQGSTYKSDDYMHGLGANERALLERIPILFLRKLAAGMVRAKMRIQFTGWLQYLLPLIFIFVLLLLAWIAHLLQISFLANLFSVLGGLLFILALFDLVTIKFKLRLPERLPQRNDPLDIFDLARARHSCRSFQTRKLIPADHNELMESVQLYSKAPTIGKAPIRFEYISAPLTVWPVVNATEFIVAITSKEYNRLAVIDVGRSLQKIVLAATRMGLGTCWIGPGADQSSIMQHLGDRFNPEAEHIICVCAVGYKSAYIPVFLRIFNKQMSSNRLPISSLFFADPNFQKPLNIEASPFNQFGRNYEICQWAPSSYNGQTTRCLASIEEDGLTRFDFYTATESRYYAPVALGIWCANWEMGSETLGIQGHFDLLPQEERESLLLPSYNLSWVEEKRS